MTDSIWHRGIPDSFFTRRSAYAVGGLIGIAGILFFSGYASLKRYVTEPTAATAPACYAASEATYEPAANRPPSDRELTRQDQAYLPRLQEAERACTPGACDSKTFEAYRSALFWYLASRLRHTRNLDRKYGDTGLRLAVRAYATSADHDIEVGLRERYRAGLFRINDFRQDGDAIAILIFKGGEALRPCRRSDVAKR